MSSRDWPSANGGGMITMDEVDAEIAARWAEQRVA
jgi:hypothetical protein